MKLSIYLFLVATVLFFSSCDELKMKPQAHTNQYFDMVGFVQNQIILLEKTPCTLNKSMTSNDLKQNTETKTIDWKEELGLFLEVDINKPVLRDMYLVNESKNFVEYIATDSKYKVQYLSIKGSPENPTEITAFLTDENQLYQTKKELQLKFDNKKLVSYKIAGQQKIIFKDALTYSMVSTVLY
jgi:hypothetical protein